MKKCKIEVLKTTFHDDLAQQYGCKNLGKCPMHKVGDIFYGDYAKPEGLCDEAWKAMYQYVFALSHGSNIFYYGDWIDKEGVAICSCNDGIRPVIFKIERTDEEWILNLSAYKIEKVRILLNKLSILTKLYFLNIYLNPILYYK